MSENLEIVAKEISELENKSQEEIYKILKTVEMLNRADNKDKKPKPRAGLFSDDFIYESYSRLWSSLEELIPNGCTSLQVRGAKEKYLAKAKIIENLAKNLRIAMEGCLN